MAEGAMEWKRITKAIFDLIPAEGRPVNISFRRDNPNAPLTWSGIVEFVEE